MAGHRNPKLVILLLSGVLLTTGVLLWLFSIEKRRNLEYFQEVVTQNLHVQLELSLKQLASITHPANLEVSDFDYPTMVFSQGQIIFWSDHRLVVGYAEIAGDEPIQFTELPQGKFLRVRKNLDDELIAIQLIELYTTPPFTNQYIERRFNPTIFPAATVFIDAVDSEELNILSPSGQPLFGVTFDSGAPVVHSEMQMIIVLVLTVALLFAATYVIQWSWFLAERGQVWTGVSLLFISMGFFRWGMLAYGFPFDIYPLELFDPRFYASSVYNPSLGDLLANVLVLVILITYGFQFIFKTDFIARISTGKTVINFTISVLLNLVGFLLLSFHFGLLENILVNSQIELDINKSVEFSSLRIVALVIFFLAAVIWFQTCHFIYNFLVKTDFYLGKLVMSLALSASLFVIISLWLDYKFITILLVQVFYLLILFLFRLPHYLYQLRYTTLFYFFAASLFSSIIGTIAIYKYHEFQELIEKQRFANDLLIENDLKGEYLLYEAVAGIQNDIFIQSRLMSPALSRAQIEQKIRRDYLGGYFDKYDVRARLYDRLGRPFGDDPDTLLNELKNKYYAQEKYHTDYPGLYFIGDLDSEQPKRYLMMIPINRYNNLIGYIVLDLRLKKVIPQTVYPELLADSRFIDNQRSFDYAFYGGALLNYKMGEFNYESLFNPEDFRRPNLYIRGIERSGFHHYGVRNSEESTLVITSPVYPTSRIISNFSFLFLASVLGVLLLLLTQLLTLASPSLKFSFSSKIQVYLNLAFFVPLVITGIVVINSLKSSYREEINRSSLKKANHLRDNLVNHVDGYLSNRINRESLSAELTDVSRYSQSDLNLYNIEGQLITSSQPLIFTNHLLSERINYAALRLIVDEDRDDVIMNESVGKLAYKNTYAAIKSFDTGELLGIIGIPFFGSRNHLQRQTIEAFTNILNIFTLVLIASLFISNVASRLLTDPLNLLTQKIRRTSLAEHNEPLDWSGDDEIGMVVKEYNKMLVNLEESKEALAQSQKELAWREIAKQVAHEIKNPLTPMKLSLQHLKRLLNNGKNKKNEEFEKPINNLLYQIDALSDIASSFSAFAKMPMPRNEPFEITSELRRITELFDNENVDLKLEIPEGECWINGDQKLMGRIISNLIINGMQSVPEGKKPVIKVKMTSKKNKVTLHVTDNGSGIPEEIQGKVFVPNFSTKGSGSGIGLAVAKRGVEHAGGSIWFDTSSGKGTTFYIDLPTTGS